MNSTVALLLSGVGGVLLGAVLVLVLRPRPTRGEPAVPAELPSVPTGVGSVLEVLESTSVILDRSEQVVIASPGASRMGLVTGGRLTKDALRDMVRETRRDGAIRTADLELPRGPFGRETLAVSARVARLGPDHVLVLVDDRTEALRIDSVRRDFVVNVSHELKTPVGALSLLAEAVLGASDDPEAVRRFAGRMRAETSRLSELVQEVINLSRLQWDDPLREPQLVDVDSVLVDAVDRSRLAAQAKLIELVCGGEDGLTVLGDPEQLVVAVRNLIDNAVNYSPEHTRVAVGVRRRAQVVEISVTDQGIGIPERDLERVFERFYRVDPARSRATGGTGLGLSIVKHVVANHGGEVGVWSTEGAGSTFTIRLPVGHAARTDDSPYAPVEPAQEAAS